MRKIGSFHLGSRHYKDEANQTIGAPLVGAEVETLVANRRSVTNRLTPMGKILKEKVVIYFKEKFGVDVKLNFSAYAGCSMCPCSPGFVIRDVVGRRRLSEDATFSVFVSEGDELEVRQPKWGPYSELPKLDEAVNQ